MTIGPEPSTRMVLMSVRLGMRGLRGSLVRCSGQRNSHGRGGANWHRIDNRRTRGKAARAPAAIYRQFRVLLPVARVPRPAGAGLPPLAGNPPLGRATWLHPVARPPDPLAPRPVVRAGYPHV